MDSISSVILLYVAPLFRTAGNRLLQSYSSSVSDTSITNEVATDETQQLIKNAFSFDDELTLPPSEATVTNAIENTNTSTATSKIDMSTYATLNENYLNALADAKNDGRPLRPMPLKVTKLLFVILLCIVLLFSLINRSSLYSFI